MRPADDGLFEVVGDHVGEPFPEGAPERIGAGVEGGAGGVEGFPGVDERDGVMAVFAAEAFDESFGVEAGVAGAEERGARAWGWMVTWCSMGSYG